MELNKIIRRSGITSSAIRKTRTQTVRSKRMLTRDFISVQARRTISRLSITETAE